MEIPVTTCQPACEFMHRVRAFAPVAMALAFAAVLAVTVAAQGADHAAAAGQPADHAAQAEHGEAGEAHEASLADFFWPVVNFSILCGTLYFLLRKPLSGYLAQRGDTIRKDLVDAARIKDAATTQLADIDRKLKALPGEIEALKARGKAEIASEEQRIAQQAEADRDRLLEQARRDIDLQVRLAKRALTEHAADLAVQLATDRIASGMTEADQARLVTRYLEQVER